MELEQELNKRRAAPASFWLQLALFIIAAIIAFFLLNNNKRKDQRNIEEKIAYSIFEGSTTSKI